MHLLKRARMLIAAALCIAAIAAPMQASAYERTLGCTYTKITGNGFVADTFNGVQARYNLGGPKLYCTELIERYCREVYGVEIRCGGSCPTVLNSDEYWFEAVSDPQPGDILFGSAAARGKGYNHWAICKSVDEEAGTITLFEQNWRWNGCAGINRVIPLENNCYQTFRMMTSIEQEAPEEATVFSSPLMRYALENYESESSLVL